MELDAKTKTQQLTETLKNNQLTVAGVALGLIASVYFSSGGSLTGAMGYLKHPFDKEARQVNSVMGYSNPAIADQLKDGRKTLEAGLETPTNFVVKQWGPEDGEKDEYSILQLVDGVEREIDNYRGLVAVHATQVKLTATLVGRDGCGDFEVYHVLKDKYHKSKICLVQGESIVVPLKKSQREIAAEGAYAKRKSDIEARRKKLKDFRFGF